MLRELYPLLVFFFAGVVAVIAALYFALVAVGRDVPGQGRRFALPIDCAIGENCFIQNYVDVDPGPAAVDYVCGGATYDGHKGTDFRVLSAAAGEGVAVVAAAGGKVLRLRDSMQDRLMRDYGSRDELKRGIGSNDCGNGVVIDHGEGWTTQYCHLRRGSISVKPGQSVQAGHRLGEVGYSGRADFAHVHLTVRHNEEVVDPFLGEAVGQPGDGQGQGASCKAGAGTFDGLWQPAIRDLLAYDRHIIFDAGFAGTPPEHNALERDHRLDAPQANSEALVFYARMMNLKAGDRIKVAVAGPDGFRAGSTTEPLERNKAVQFIFAGKKRTAERWPAGQYKGGVAVLRRPGEGEAAKVIAEKRLAFDLP